MCQLYSNRCREWEGMEERCPPNSTWTGSGIVRVRGWAKRRISWEGLKWTSVVGLTSLISFLLGQVSWRFLYFGEPSLIIFVYGLYIQPCRHKVPRWVKNMCMNGGSRIIRRGSSPSYPFRSSIKFDPLICVFVPTRHKFLTKSFVFIDFMFLYLPNKQI